MRRGSQLSMISSDSRREVGQWTGSWWCNAARHGRASTVWAQLSTKDDRIELRVRDDGVGGQDVRPGMGMGGMQERAQAAGGQFRYSTAPNAGFETVLELPHAGVQAAAG